MGEKQSEKLYKFAIFAFPTVLRFVYTLSANDILSSETIVFGGREVCVCVCARASECLCVDETISHTFAGNQMNKCREQMRSLKMTFH